MNRSLALLVCLFLSTPSFAVPAPPVPDAQVVAFFSRDAHSLSKAFAGHLGKTDAAALRSVFDRMQVQEAAELGADLKKEGIEISQEDLAAAIAEARGLSGSQALLARRTSDPQGKAMGPDMDKVGAQAAALGGTPSGDAPSLVVQPSTEDRVPFGRPAFGRNLELDIMVGGGGIQGGRAVGSGGAMVRSPLLGLGGFGHIGGEVGILATGRDGSERDYLGRTYTDSWTDYDGHPHETFNDYNRNRNNFTEVFDFMGLYYRTPEVKGFSLEAGGRAGWGANDHTTVVTENGTHRYVADVDRCVSYGDSCYWETFHEWREYSTGSRELSRGGPRTSGFVPSVYLAANAAINETWGMRFEVGRHFMHNLKMEAMDTARVALTFKF